MSAEMMAWSWLLAPLAASLLITLALVPLGITVLQRGVVFADLAIAQWAALGALIGGTASLTLAGLPLTALAAALVCVALVHTLVRNQPRHREALIGLLYVLGASLATLVVSQDPHGAQRLAQTLDGDLLWTTTGQLPALALMALLVQLWQHGLNHSWQQRLFLPLFAVAVAVAVTLAGIYVVFVSLIATPLVACARHGRSGGAVVACLAGHALGLALSATLDLPAGTCVVLATLAMASLWWLIGLRASVASDHPAAGHQTTGTSSPR